MARQRRVEAKPRELRARWGLDDVGDGPDLVFAWGEGCHKGDAALLSDLFNHAKLYGYIQCAENNKSFLQHLKERGYDISTLRFSIQKLAKD